MIISWKLFWTILTGVLTAAVAIVTALFTVSLLVMLPATVLAAGVFVAATHRVVHGAAMFSQVTLRSKEQIVRWIGAAAVTHVGWVAAFGLRPQLWVVWLCVLGGLGVLEYWLARGHEYLLTQLTPVTPGGELRNAEQQRRAADQTEKVFAAALSRSGFDWLTVLGWQAIGTPPFGVRFRVRTPSRMALAQSGDKKDTPRLTVSSAEPIAIGLGEVMDTELESDWVSITKERTAGTYSVVVVTEDVMARVYQYEDTPEWTSITTPAMVGYQLDGQPYHLPLKQHGQVIGQSTYGKSSLINVAFAHITRCADALLWVCGVEKLYDLVGGWIEPYMDTGIPLPFDWIANGQHDTLDMLVAAMNVARWRQKQPMSRRGGWKTIIVVLDEASFALQNRTTRAVYQGIARTAAEIAEVGAKGAASGDVHFLFASQRSTNDNFGDQGGNLTANMGYSAGFRSKDDAEIGRLMGDYKLPMPRHKGEYWLDAGNGDLPLRLKAPYIQSVDPTKPRLHQGATVSDIAWSRRAFHRDLDTGSAGAAGSAYERRHTRMDTDLLRYLTEVEELCPAPSSAVQSGYALAMAELSTLGAGAPKISSDQDTKSEAGVPTVVGRPSRADRIVEIVRNSPEPMSPGEVVTTLREGGDPVSEQVVMNVLVKKVAEGVFHRPDRGLYVTR